jgi:hypothetical protein
MYMQEIKKRKKEITHICIHLCVCKSIETYFQIEKKTTNIIIITHTHTLTQLHLHFLHIRIHIYLH